MSTRSYIGYEDNSGGIKAVYCHQDGNVGNVGGVLVRNYDKLSKVEELVGRGGFSRLGESIKEVEYYTGDSEPVVKFKDYKEYQREMIDKYMSVENVYLFRRGEWYVIRKNKNGNKFEKVKLLLGLYSEDKVEKDTTFDKLLDIVINYMVEIEDIKLGFRDMAKSIVEFDKVSKKYINKIEGLNYYKPLKEKGVPNKKERLGNLSSVFIGDSKGEDAILLEFKINPNGQIVGVEVVTLTKGRIDGSFYSSVGHKENYRLNRLPNYYRHRVLKTSGNKVSK